MFRKIIIPLFAFILLLIILGWINIPKAPPAPVTGPGSLEYGHSEVIKTTYGEGASQYWIYEPSSPKPYSAPIIVFNHGWAATNPEVYQAWIFHIVRRGNIVIYPRYQENIFTPSDDFTPNAMDSVKSALKELNKGNHVRLSWINLQLLDILSGVL